MKLAIMEPVSGTNSASAKNLMKQLGARIKQIRMERGFTQECLADAMGSHASYIGAIEIGRKFPRAETLIKIAGSLEVPVYQLFLFENDIPEKQQSIQELVDYLKRRPESDARFLLSMCRELAREYSVGKTTRLPRASRGKRT